jgi:hypothetical protein
MEPAQPHELPPITLEKRNARCAEDFAGRLEGNREPFLGGSFAQLDLDLPQPLQPPWR